MNNDRHFIGKLDIFSRRSQILLNITSLLVLVAFSGLFLFISIVIRPEFNILQFLRNYSEIAIIGPLVLLGYSLAILALVVCIHEGIHGLFQWIFSHKRPDFGHVGINPYAALAPNVRISRNQGVICSLAPLVIITILGIGLLPIIPVTILPILLAFTTFNAAISVGDLAVARWLLSYGGNVLWGRDGTLNIVYEKSSTSALDNKSS